MFSAFIHFADGWNLKAWMEKNMEILFDFVRFVLFFFFRNNKNKLERE